MELTRVTEHDLELITDREVAIIRSEGNQDFISGYAVVWFDALNPGTTYKLPDGVLERVDRHAFDDLLKRDANFPIVYSHDASHYLGDTETKTAFVEADDVGLKVTVPIDKEDPTHTNVIAKLRKNIIKGMSFQGNGISKKVRDASGKFISVIQKVTRLDDLSFVHKPAYKATTAMICRSEVAAYDAEVAKQKRIKEILTKVSKYK